MTILQHPVQNTNNDNNAPQYAIVSKYWLIFAGFTAHSNDGIAWNEDNPNVPPKYFLILLRKLGIGRSPSLPSNCLFWFKATRNAKTKKKI